MGEKCDNGTNYFGVKRIKMDLGTERIVVEQKWSEERLGEEQITVERNGLEERSTLNEFVWRKTERNEDVVRNGTKNGDLSNHGGRRGSYTPYRSVRTGGNTPRPLTFVTLVSVVDTRTLTSQNYLW